MATPIDWTHLVEVLLPGGIIGLLGWWSGRRQEKVSATQRAREQALQSEESQGNRAFKEAERVSAEWKQIQEFWTRELEAARVAAQGAQKAEEECVLRYRELWRWSVKLSGKWNTRHPDDLMELPNGNGAQT